MEAPDFWNDQAAAQQTVKEASRLKGRLHPFLKLEERLQNVEAGIELAREFDDADSAREAAGLVWNLKERMAASLRMSANNVLHQKTEIKFAE